MKKLFAAVQDFNYTDPETGEFSEERFWLEKVFWAEDGDRTPDGAHCIRIDGAHYVAQPGLIKKRAFMGHGGSVFYWRELATGVMYFTNNMWFQGRIPERFRDQLPDNAEFVPHLTPCICTRNDEIGRILNPDCLRERS